jgi:hypothetical protein
VRIKFTIQGDKMSLSEAEQVDYQGKRMYIWRLLKEAVILLNSSLEKPLFVKVKISELSNNTEVGYATA